ncbi:MAG: chemotaxis response regulator protein-glutamate methylesterase [Pseudomonadaceae bacterium]|nr:chemotaxis response regulator protein-glutamate methylesterase [Pseudomonadaceae bacterium]
MTKRIRVLVVDDSSFMRSALVRMIETNPRFEVVGTAENGQKGVEMAKQLRPDAMTMDIEMPVMNGIEALREIMASVKTPVIMISTLSEAGAKITLEALSIGAVDFIPKALHDKGGNIFREAETLQAKLMAAAGVADASPVAPKVPGTPAPAAVVAGPVKLAAAPVGRIAPQMVVIGSSTGGPRALQSVVAALPENIKVPVVVAQHMPAEFTKALANRLDETCKVRVVEAADGMAVQAGQVYIAPGGKHLRVEGGVFKTADDAGESLYKPSVDVLADSARKAYGRNVLAVMLTGMGNDGTRAFCALKGDGAYVLAQDQATSVVYGMPKAVADAGAVHEVLPLEAIGGRIGELVR